ncbi:MAG: hypothetical protein U5O69_04730 [Candidatus Competibacteraceae bacterium]|nr:hypothetical protein [Candidatus Competibacteraceae bacterium]
MNTLEVRLASAPSSFLVVTIVAPEELPLHLTVQWTPSSLYTSLAAGESTTIIASFVPTANATNVSVGVLPELAPYVSVSPASFHDAGHGFPVPVNVLAPSDAFTGIYDNERSSYGRGPRTLKTPLATMVVVDGYLSTY